MTDGIQHGPRFGPTGILRVMRDPDEFPVALSSSFSIVAAVCLPFAALGYYAFGAPTAPSALLVPLEPLETFEIFFKFLLIQRLRYLSSARI